MFEVLCHSERMHPVFLEIVTSFGFKIEEEDEYFTPCTYNFTVPQTLSYGK
jgi:hypothetical protein